MASLEEILEEGVNKSFAGFYLDYQPQFWASSGKLYGAEALARFYCKEYGAVSPEIFIPILEKKGHMIPFGRWVFAEAVAQGKAWIDRYPEFQISINMSGYQFSDFGIPEYMNLILKKIGFPAENIIVEITENCEFYFSEKIEEVLKRIKDIGMKIAMDDFGTGNANLFALKKYYFDIIKIARQLIPENTMQNKDFLPIVSSLCHSVGAKVCLEGIETRSQYDVAIFSQVDIVQGYLFARPLKAEVFRKKYLENSDMNNPVAYFTVRH